MTTTAASINVMSVMATVCTARRPHDGMNTSLKVISRTGGMRASAANVSSNRFISCFKCLAKVDHILDLDLKTLNIKFYINNLQNDN